MFRILGLVFVLNMLSTEAYATTPTCTNCPPLYCEDPQAAQQALERKKNNARAQGMPERLIKLFDRLDKCVGCVEMTPDGFTIAWEVNADAFEKDRGRSPGATKYSMAWSADIEKKLRDDMRRGVVKEFHIVHYAGPPCSCCKGNSQNAVKQWIGAQSATGSKIPGYNQGLEFHPDAAISYTNPKGLGRDPKDLTEIPEAYRRGNTLKSTPLETFMDPVIRVVQVMCPECQKTADKYNKLGEDINKMREPLAQMRRDIAYSRQLIRDVWLEIEGNDKAAYTKDTGRKSKELYEEIGGHQRSLEKHQKRLTDKLAERAKLEQELNAVKEELKACEEQGCKPAAATTPKNQACSLPGKHPSITIGSNSEFGSSAQLGNEIKDKAKGAAMGAVGGLLGGGGMSLGGGGGGGGIGAIGSPGSGSSQKGPKTDKDPTSGQFIHVSGGNTDLEIRAGYTKDGLVVSTEIDDTPGDGTFHAQWLQDGNGKIYLPTQFLIFELYRDWNLSVWWTHDKWVNGEHVYHDEGDSMTTGRDSMAMGKMFGGTKGVGNSIWNTLGFKTATKGVQHLGAVYNVPTSVLDGPCPMQLVTHISLPDQDPVKTVAVVGELSGKRDASQNNPVITVRPPSSKAK